MLESGDDQANQTALPDESARLEALYDLRILDTEQDAAFDALTRVAAQIFSTPMALVSLVDRDRQWFKSRIGIEDRQTDLARSFCVHALGKPAPLVVEDALADPRFKENPSVTEPPHVRFYAGAQLRTAGGHDIGTLCVIDDQPHRAPTAEQLSLLSDLASVVTLLIEQRRRVEDLAVETERRRRAEENAIAARREAEEANAAMRGFFSKMSHDLRTPLGVILGFAEFLREEDLPEQQKQDAEEIYQAGRKMLTMINDLLQAGRIVGDHSSPATDDEPATDPSRPSSAPEDPGADG